MPYDQSIDHWFVHFNQDRPTQWSIQATPMPGSSSFKRIVCGLKNLEECKLMHNFFCDYFFKDYTFRFEIDRDYKEAIEILERVNKKLRNRFGLAVVSGSLANYIGRNNHD